jgi:hypothetical protein
MTGDQLGQDMDMDQDLDTSRDTTIDEDNNQVNIQYFDMVSFLEDFRTMSIFKEKYRYIH